jgi:hypothetical protein
LFWKLASPPSELMGMVDENMMGSRVVLFCVEQRLGLVRELSVQFA